jgi:hypothetical protein
MYICLLEAISLLDHISGSKRHIPYTDDENTL